MPGANDDVRAALVRQWELIAGHVAGAELSEPSRIAGWTNREVLAHLYAQVRLAARFLQSGSGRLPSMGLSENLRGTKSFSEIIDASARQGAASNKVDLRIPLVQVRSLVLTADLNSTIVTLQGSILVSDYLVTRCVEAVVHGGDLVQPVAPDPRAQAIAAEALMEALSLSAPHLVNEARALPAEGWIDVATGRASASGPLAAATPVMT